MRQSFVYVFKAGQSRRAPNIYKNRTLEFFSCLYKYIRHTTLVHCYFPFSIIFAVLFNMQPYGMARHRFGFASRHRK